MYSGCVICNSSIASFRRREPSVEAMNRMTSATYGKRRDEFFFSLTLSGAHLASSPGERPPSRLGDLHAHDLGRLPAAADTLRARGRKVRPNQLD
jgi:hypothetical protein